MAKREAVKARRVLFNADGGQLSFGPYPLSRADFAKYLFGPLEQSHVDTVLWCIGNTGNAADYPSEVMDLYGCKAAGYRFQHSGLWLLSNNLRHLIDSGAEPPKVVVEEAHRRGMDAFATFRLNDPHDNFSEDEVPRFKREHPEWTMGGSVPGIDGRFRHLLNFAVKEVRDFKVRFIEEVLTRYAFDGVELDFMRGPYFLPPGDEYRLRYALTDFVRTVRQTLDRIAQARGRRIEVSARVDETVEICLLDGFDVERWAQEGLVDILTVSNSGGPEVEPEGFKRAVAGTPVRLYASLYPAHHAVKAFEECDEKTCAGAMILWAKGFEAIETFNWFPYGSYQSGLLKEIGDPEALRYKDKIYPGRQRLGGRPDPMGYYPHNNLHGILPVDLYATAAGGGPEIPLEVWDDVAAAERAGRLGAVTLRLRISGHTMRDQYEVRLNDQALRQVEWEPVPVAPSHGSPYLSCGGTYEAYIPLDPGLLRLGRNALVFTLLERGAEMASPVRVENMDVCITYA